MARRPDRERPTVLVVEDEPELLEIYGEWLAESYDVKRAANGMTALEFMDESVEVVLLDRRMPDMSGGQVLARIREDGYECKVAMVTAVEPDIDVTDMGFDDYVRKPVTYEDVHDVVERLLSLRSYDRRLQEYFAVVSKLVALNSADKNYRGTEGYRALVERKRQLRAEIDQMPGSPDQKDFESAMTDFAELDVWAD